MLVFVGNWSLEEAHCTAFLGSVQFSVLQCIFTLGDKLRLNIKPFPDDKVIVMEVDELWHYLKKSKKFRFLKPMIAIEHDIFKAYDRHRTRCIDWECGDRSHAPFKLYKLKIGHSCYLDYSKNFEK